jgi:ligand-binding SRPBCC domain-containing protein
MSPRVFAYESQLWLPAPLDAVFPFFSDARNLERLTPPWLRFEVLTRPPMEMRPGALIDYRLRVRGIPLRWRSEITAWEPPHRFVDEQRRGPYRRWHHEHTFTESEGGTLAGDRVEYSVLGGAIMDRLFVRRDVEKIFAYRRAVLSELFGRADAGSA